MDINSGILSEITTFMKYARYKSDKQRRETWEELITRNKDMHIKKFPHAKDIIEEAFGYVYSKRVLPSMRSLQFAGKAIEQNPIRMFNCSGINMDDWRAFPEIMLLLLSGTGVGLSVQKHHVDKLPAVAKPNAYKTRRYIIGDSVFGWADAVKQLIKSYYGITSSTIVFDYSDIREKGAELVTSGGKAPGPQPLKECLVKIEGIFANKADGEKLTTVEVADICCFIAEAVLSGGIRRAALMILFSKSDLQMRGAKMGNWWELNPQRAMANISVALDRATTTKAEFASVWDYAKNSGAGEPGHYWTNHPDWLPNPCCEISFPGQSFCNLVEINVSDVSSNEELTQRVWAATVIATLQAAYTDFPYLRDTWRRQAEEDALIGVSMTGVASNKIFDLDIEGASQSVVDVNKFIAKLIGINPAKRATAIKPAGTTSLVLGTSSGVHAWHNDYFLRRIRVAKTEAIYTYLTINHPELLEDDWMNPDTTAVIVVPVKAPVGAVTRKESVFDLLNRVLTLSKAWIRPGHIEGKNRNNVSCTITIKDHEWDAVRDWMWNNREEYTGMAILPYSDHTYKQAPFEDCSKEEYEARSRHLREVDLSNVVELGNFTDLKGEAACGSGGCEVK